MAATCTLTAGPTAIGAGLKMATYSVLLDTATASGGEAIDISGEFTYMHFGVCGANDTAADNYVGKLDLIHPGAGTAVSSSNVLVTACESSDTNEPFTEFTGNLATVGELQVMIIGK